MSERPAGPRAAHGLCDSGEPEFSGQVSKECEYQGHEFEGSGEAAGDTGKMLAWVHLHGHLNPRFMNMQMVGLLR